MVHRVQMLLNFILVAIKTIRNVTSKIMAERPEHGCYIAEIMNPTPTQQKLYAISAYIHQFRHILLARFQGIDFFLAPRAKISIVLTFQ